MSNGLTPYPEHEKMRAIADQSQAIGEFLEWLPGEGLRVCEPLTMIECHNSGRGMFGLDGKQRSVRRYYRCRGGKLLDDDTDEFLGHCGACEGTGMVERDNPLYMPAHVDITKLLAKFFEIDLDKIETEKRAMLDALRAANA